LFKQTDRGLNPKLGLEAYVPNKFASVGVNFQTKITVIAKEKEAKRKGCGNMENSIEFTTFPHLKQ
jgi:hypothetical protein